MTLEVSWTGGYLQKTGVGGRAMCATAAHQWLGSTVRKSINALSVLGRIIWMTAWK